MQSDLFGVGSVLWETLTGDRLFDGKNDIEVFKKIRACQIPSIQTRRKDVPAAFAAILELALSADPANRYATADEFAHALDQVVKQAVGFNTATALGAAVAEVRTRLKQTARDSDDQSTTEHRANVTLDVSMATADGVPPELPEPSDPSDPSDPSALPELPPLYDVPDPTPNSITVPGFKRRPASQPDKDKP